ncbi:MAG: asparagine synthase (glutamine-hydrolyzing), partial [Clostridia bacterium]|nr:asparagine synthase (glutamine-hydrolyzing) [Clostridia bacterium]
MCGIVGFSGNREDREHIIREMADAIRHRGPDGEGYYCGDGITLGHRRLAIIDLVSGDQPLYSEDGSLVLIFNGEIYNFQELRADLAGKGHRFATNSDGEVLVHGYEEYGCDFVKRLRGMFAYALWDEREKTLFAARDFYGIKPFYYYLDGGLLLFSSEIKAFLKHPEFRKEFNGDQLPLYLSCQYSPGEETFFKNVRKLMPAHYLIWKNGELTVTRYYSPSFEADENKSESDWVEEIDRIMADSVKAHKISDVEVGSFLSSGVDSSYVASIADVDKTFTVGYENPQYDEAEYAKAFAAGLGVEEHVRYIRPEEYWDAIPKIQYHMDEPLADAAGAALFFLNEEASRYVKVCLSGEGADEFFGGYNVYQEPFAVSWYDRLPAGIRKALGRFARKHPTVKGANFLIRRSMPLEERYIGNTNLMSEAYKKRLLAHYPEGQKTPADLVRPLQSQISGLDPVSKMQFIDLHTWLVGDILLKADKMSMAHSLELRVPFLDREVF